MAQAAIQPLGTWSTPRRTLLWGALVLLLVVAQSLLVVLTVEYESQRHQDRADVEAAAAAAEVKQTVTRDVQSLQSLLWNEVPLPQWTLDAIEMLRQRRTIYRAELRDADMAMQAAVDSPFRPPLFAQMPRREIQVEAELACASAERLNVPIFSRSYFVPQPGGLGVEVIDVCLPVRRGSRLQGYLVATFSLRVLLDEGIQPERSREHELVFVEADGTRLARSGPRRGSTVFVAQRPVDLPGITLQLRADSVEGRPSLIPNLATALVLGLSLMLFGVVMALARDVRRRASAERALADALAFRRAMEDSLVTGLRARDLQGRVTYVNPAFAAMVGYSVDELMRAGPLPPYCPPERVAEYEMRQRERIAGVAPPREGFETVYMRKNGERFPVMVYEAPLVDRLGRQAGWMSATVDLSAQRRIEELSRQQQERLQASARLAAVGEMASLLSHELNQPLAAIASYATGSLNLLDQPDDETPAMMRQALTRIAEQADRAGRVIKSVHGFVRRRESARVGVRCDELIESVLPLVRLQARKSGARLEVDCPKPPPRTVCDRTMVEQVLLNLTRNGLQAMEASTPLEQRVLTIRVRQTHERWISFGVIDRGAGIPADVASRLFTPFFTTRTEGMGLGLSLCRTVIEQHGGALDFGPGDAGVGTEFRFTLPADKTPSRVATPTS